MTQWLGDYKEDETLYFLWSTNNGDGASITRAVDGTVSVYKDNNVAQSVAGVTDTEDFDSLTGIHACTIDLSADAFYATGADYSVVLSAATIDGQTVNAVLAHFSIENRFQEVDVVKWLGQACAAVSQNGVPEVDLTYIAGALVAAASAQLGVNVVSVANDAITAAAIATGAIDADAIAADAITAAKIAANAITSSELADGAITAAKIATDAITAAKIAADAITSSELAASAAQEIADAFLDRDMSAAPETNARSPLNALRHLRNKWGIVADVLTVCKEDDVTTAWTADVTANASADPVVEVDPT